MLLGVDTGGTFTDFVCFDAGGLRFHKVLSTPDDPSRAILQGIRELGLDSSSLHVVHGSTVATNAILERKGVRTLFVTQHGLQDLLSIGRQTRAELYQLCPDAVAPLLPSDDCIGVSARINAEGEEQTELQASDIQAVLERVGDYEAVAICLLFSFINPKHELELADQCMAQFSAQPSAQASDQTDKITSNNVFISLSHQVLAEYREYERAATTVLNAYVGPLVQRYLQRLQDNLAAKHLFVMHSAGGVMPAEQAAKQAVRLVLSGPAGGLVAAQEIGLALGKTNLLSFDMGGTSTDVALLQGRARKTIEGQLAGMPVALPMLDIHTIGAGGGSLAWLDEAGLPQVGPASAGAMPGPVCYALGGTQATVTDANLVLGRIPADACLAGSMRLDLAAAHAACAAYGKALDLSAEYAAQAIVEIAEQHMAAALRLVSVQRGHDPADFSLLCFGGAGALHACALAEKLGMRNVIIPLGSGAFSALGMVLGKQQSEFSRSRRLALADQHTPASLRELFAEMEAEAAQEMGGLQLNFEYAVDLRYVGQGFHLSIAWEPAGHDLPGGLSGVLSDGLSGDLGDLAQRFETAHQQAYGHQLDRPIEIMTARLTAFVDRPVPVLPELEASAKAASAMAYSKIWLMDAGQSSQAAHYRRRDIMPGVFYAGPALVLEDTATLWLAEGWQMHASKHGHLLLEYAP
ncbi:MAG: hydantoinase/oxoprolinase family protein [Mariprofundus sp.]|nr:hydantoinase/oxoprolinase family protein [Mariprofundus sp.]